MLLPDKDGIACDFCGTTYKKEFSYYSTRAIKFVVASRNKTIIKSPPQKVDFDRDMCEICYDEIIEQVKTNLGNAKRGQIKCDLSKTYKSNDFEYYLLLFDRVTVDEKAVDHVSVEREVMDLNVIVGFDKLVGKLEVTKKKMQDQGVWT